MKNLYELEQEHKALTNLIKAKKLEAIENMIATGQTIINANGVKLELQLHKKATVDNCQEGLKLQAEVTFLEEALIFSNAEAIRQAEEKLIAAQCEYNSLATHARLEEARLKLRQCQLRLVKIKDSEAMPFTLKVSKGKK